MARHNRNSLLEISFTPIFILLVLNILLSGCGEDYRTKHRKLEKPPVLVKVAEVFKKSVPVEMQAFGAIEPSVSVTIKSQATGILAGIKFKEGQEVRKGDILFIVDPVPYENELKKAEANLSRDRIQHENAAKEARRQHELLSKGLTSEDLYDQAKTSADALGATVRFEEAAAENARIKLSYCTIRAPIDGRTGKYMIDQGNLVKADETALTTINQIKPVEAVFSIPEKHLGEIHRQMTAGNVEALALLPDEQDKPERGILTFIDNSVDRLTGTITLKAVFPNDGYRLWPGQFVKLSIILSVQTDAIAVPSHAVQTGQKGTYVYVIRPDMSAENRQVKVARQSENLAIICDGLQPGELVVIEGQQRIGGIDTRIQISNTPTNTPVKP